MAVTNTQQVMNELGKAARPFLFVLDFELSNCLLYPLDEIPVALSFSIGKFAYGRAFQRTGLPQLTAFEFTPHAISLAEYLERFEIAQKEIRRGNTFLLNLSFASELRTNLSLFEIFNLADAPYKLLLEDEFTIFSPECFVKIRDGQISTYPMKGTISAEIPDAEIKLRTDEKEIAEHSTVVDLLRNDLSIFASNVRVEKFMYIETVCKHAGSLLQMSSEVTGVLPPDYRSCIGDIIFSMLPAGSITGAPKPETLRIIKEIETSRRGYYTGVFGVFDGQDLDSAVMIRFVENRDGKLWYRSGGGITADSIAVKEYEEMLHKIYVPISAE